MIKSFKWNGLYIKGPVDFTLYIQNVLGNGPVEFVRHELSDLKFVSISPALTKGQRQRHESTAWQILARDPDDIIVLLQPNTQPPDPEEYTFEYVLRRSGELRQKIGLTQATQMVREAKSAYEVRVASQMHYRQTNSGMIARGFTSEPMLQTLTALRVKYPEGAITVTVFWNGGVDDCIVDPGQIRDLTEDDRRIIADDPDYHTFSAEDGTSWLRGSFVSHTLRVTEMQCVRCFRVDFVSD